MAKTFNDTFCSSLKTATKALPFLLHTQNKDLGDFGGKRSFSSIVKHFKVLCLTNA